MKLIRFGSEGRECPGLLMPDGSRIDVSAFGEDYDESFFASDGMTRLRSWSEEHAQRCPAVPHTIRLGPPVKRPGKILCAGLNFKDHAREVGLDLPAEPALFLKSPTALCGPNDPLVIPRGSEQTDWEVELAMIICREAKYVREEEALNYVAGYVLFIDYSERSYQLERGGQWTKGKSCDSFAPLGPYLASPDEVGRTDDLSLWLRVNGEVRQNSSTDQFIFTPAQLVSYASQFMTLKPGDVFSTGTPPGVGMGQKPPQFLKPGDVVEAGISNLGEQRQVARASA